MTKKETAEEILKQNGDCFGICCTECFYPDCEWDARDKLEEARKYLNNKEIPE